MNGYEISSCRGTTIDSITILSTKRFSFLSVSLAVIGVLASGEGEGRENGLGVGNGDPRFDPCCFSSMARAFFRNCSTFSTRLVFFPPCQMKIADAMPQRKLAGIKIPVDHGGRSNLRTNNLSHQYDPTNALQYLSRPHIVPHRMTWKNELPSLKQQIINAVLFEVSANRSALVHQQSTTHLIGKALCVAVPWGRYHV